jgi:hypothetical protein
MFQYKFIYIDGVFSFGARCEQTPVRRSPRPEGIRHFEPTVDP